MGPVLTKIANLPTRSVRYLDAGSGRTMVLLHAFPLSADQWLPQVARVAPGWRVIAPDLRGFRQPDAVADDSGGVDGHASDVVELLDHLDVRRAVVAGLSMGGYVAFALMRRAPARVSGLVLADTRATADSSEARAAREDMLRLVAVEGPAGVARVMVPKLLGETTKREQPDLADAVTRLIEANGASGIAAGIRALRDRPDASLQLASITCPTLIVCGDEDALTPPSDSEAMHRAIAGSRLVIIPRSGHLSNLENAPAFNGALFSALHAD
jgi:pimeloyl-ACP methyl ester carboxylesterase